MEWSAELQNYAPVSCPEIRDDSPELQIGSPELQNASSGLQNISSGWWVNRGSLVGRSWVGGSLAGRLF